MKAPGSCRLFPGGGRWVSNLKRGGDLVRLVASEAAPAPATPPGSLALSLSLSGSAFRGPGLVHLASCSGSGSRKKSTAAATRCSAAAAALPREAAGAPAQESAPRAHGEARATLAASPLRMARKMPRAEVCADCSAPGEQPAEKGGTEGEGGTRLGRGLRPPAHQVGRGGSVRGKGKGVRACCAERCAPGDDWSLPGVPMGRIFLAPGLLSMAACGTRPQDILAAGRGWDPPPWPAYGHPTPPRSPGADRLRPELTIESRRPARPPSATPGALDYPPSLPAILMLRLCRPNREGP